MIKFLFSFEIKLIIPIYKLEESENFDGSTGCQDSCTLRVIRKNPLVPKIKIIPQLTNDHPNPPLTGQNLLSVESETWYRKVALVSVSLRSSEVLCRVVLILFPSLFSTTVETGIEFLISQYCARVSKLLSWGGKWGRLFDREQINS